MNTLKLEIQLRSSQIADLQQKIVDADQGRSIFFAIFNIGILVCDQTTYLPETDFEKNVCRRSGKEALGQHPHYG